VVILFLRSKTISISLLGFSMFINQPDLVLDKIFSFLTVFEVQRLALLSKLMNRKISENSIWKNLLLRESLQYAFVSPTFAKRAVLSLNSVTLPINEYKVKFFFQLKYNDEVIASGGPCTISEQETFDWDLRLHLFIGYTSVPFKAIDADNDFNLKVDARFEGMIANIAHADIGNWDEDHWWSEGAADAGEFSVDLWMVFEYDYDDYPDVCVISAGGPHLEFHNYNDSEGNIPFSRYLEQLTWKPYQTDSSEVVGSL